MTAVCGPEIPMIRVSPDRPVMGSIYTSDSGKEFRVETVTAKNQTQRKLFSGDKPVASICDFCSTRSGAFCRRITAVEELRFTVIPACGAVLHDNFQIRYSNSALHSVWITPESDVPAGYESPLGGHLLYVAAGGRVRADRAELIFDPGESYLIIVAAGDPNEAAHKMSMTVRQLENGLPDLSAVRRNRAPKKASGDAIDHALNVLLNQRTEDGFVLSDIRRPAIDPITQYLAVRAFIRAAKPLQASKIIEAYRRAYEKRGFLYWEEEGGVRTLPSVYKGSIVPALVILAALEIPAKHFPESNYSFLLSLAKDASDDLLLYMMPFNGNEHNDHARYLPHQGSSLATLLFAESTLRLAARMKRLKFDFPKELSKAADGALLNYHKHFTDKGTPLLNCPARTAVGRLPKYRFGYCSICSRREKMPVMSWTVRSASGVYACLDCSKTSGEAIGCALDPLYRKPDYVNVLRAAYLGSSFFPSVTVKQILRSVISAPGEVPLLPWEYGMIAKLAESCRLDEAFVDRAFEILEASRFGSVDPVSGPPAQNTVLCPDAAACAAYVIAKI